LSGKKEKQNKGAIRGIGWLNQTPGRGVGEKMGDKEKDKTESLWIKSVLVRRKKGSTKGFILNITTRKFPIPNFMGQ